MTDLHNIPRVHLAILPTPIQYLPRLSQYLGYSIWIKRDDLTGDASGRSGNKTRNLEFVIADALAKGADYIIAEGHFQSNNCRQAAAAASYYGLGCNLILKGEEVNFENYSGNMLLDACHGANIHMVPDAEAVVVKREEIISKGNSNGQKGYWIPTGSSNEIGMLGYMNAIEEIAKQEEIMGIKFNHMIHTSSSGGTRSGITVGRDRIGWNTEIHSVSNDDTNLYEVPQQDAIATIIEKSRKLYNVQERKDLKPNTFHAEYSEGGYANPQPRDIEAIATMFALESIYLDPVYTCRMGAFLIDACKNNRFKKDDKILLVHTGGQLTMHSDRYRKELYPLVARRAQEIRKETNKISAKAA